MNEICFKIANKMIERSIWVADGVPYKSSVKNLVSGMEWHTDGKEPLIAFQGIELRGSEVCAEENKLFFMGMDFTICWEFSVKESRGQP